MRSKDLLRGRSGSGVGRSGRSSGSGVSRSSGGGVASGLGGVGGGVSSGGGGVGRGAGSGFSRGGFSGSFRGGSVGLFGRLAASGDGESGDGGAGDEQFAKDVGGHVPGPLETEVSSVITKLPLMGNIACAKQEYAVLLAKGKSFIHATVITFLLRPCVAQKSLAFPRVARGRVIGGPAPGGACMVGPTGGY